MKVILRVLLALVLVWSGLWFGVSHLMRSTISTWFAERAAAGWQADYVDLTASGYPLQVITTLKGPALADPDTGTAWSAEGLEFRTRSLWPGTQDLHFPATPQRLSYYDQTLVITASDLIASLDLKMGSAFELQHLGLTSGTWQIAGESAPLMQAMDATATMTQLPRAEDYSISLIAEGFQPGDDLLANSADLPDRFQTLRLQALVRFDRPWDRRALNERRPQPRYIDLELVDIHWGPMRLLIAGKLDVDEAGTPSGSITIKAENWRDMLALAQANGALSENAVGTAERVLNLMTGVGGNPQALDVTLALRDGYVALGPIPLGPAPKLILR